MKKFLTIFAILLFSITIANAADLAPAWKIIPAKSKIEFKVAQDNSIISGSFKKFSGKINFDPAQLKTSKVEIEIDIASVDASLASASETLQGTSWFASKAFPKATFTATKFSSKDNKNYRADGVLTIKGNLYQQFLNLLCQNFPKPQLTQLEKQLSNALPSALVMLIQKKPMALQMMSR